MFARRWTWSTEVKNEEKKKVFNNTAALNNIDQLNIYFFLQYADQLLKGVGYDSSRKNFKERCNNAAIGLGWAVNVENVTRYSFHIDEFIANYLLYQKWINSNEPNHNTTNWQNVVRNHLTNVVKKNVKSNASLRTLIKMYIFEQIYGSAAIYNEKVALAFKA